MSTIQESLSVRAMQPQHVYGGRSALVPLHQKDLPSCLYDAGEGNHGGLAEDPLFESAASDGDGGWANADLEVRFLAHS